MNLDANILEAKKALTEKPLNAASAERFLILDEIKDKYTGLPQPLQFSHILGELLSRVSVPVEAYDLIAGRIVDRELTEEEEARFPAFLASPYYPARLTLFGSGHCSYDWESLLKLGLPGLIRETQSSLEAHRGDPEKEAFLTGAMEVYVAIQAYMHRYADAAEEKGLPALAERLRLAADTAPERFDVALKLFFIITLIDCSYITPNPTLTLGRLDSLLLPLYRKGLREGTLTEETAEAFITDYYCKNNLNMGRGEHQLGDASNATTFERILNFDAPQYLLLAGSREDGSPAVNELSLLFARAIVPAFKNPVAVVYYTLGMEKDAPEFWQTLMEKALKSSSMMIYQDESCVRSFTRMGFPEALVRKEHLHYGCNWASPFVDSNTVGNGPFAFAYPEVLPEKEAAEFRKAMQEELPDHLRGVPKTGYALWRHSQQPYGELDWPVGVMDALNELAAREDLGEILSVDDLFAAFFTRMEQFYEQRAASVRYEIGLRKRHPALLLSMTDCFRLSSIRRAEGSHASGCLFVNAPFRMFGTVADCFIVTDELVFRKKLLTLRSLLTAAAADFKGFEKVLALCRGVEKYGSDSERSNALAERLANGYIRIIDKFNRQCLENEGFYLQPGLETDTWNIKLGALTGATVDGRLAGEPFSMNSKPSNGACTNGVGAMLNAMLHVTPMGMTSGALNLDVQPKDFPGEAGKKMLGALLASYFERGGLHAQVSAVSVEDLKDARIHPDQHRDLRVRVTGYSGIFVDMCDRLQQDIIKRMSS